MDYKKILPNKELRFKILEFFDFIPDKLMIRIQYFLKTNRILNLKNPKKYTEKLQWYKLNYRNSLMTQVADKYLVREYIKDKGLENILVPLYGVYDNSSEINFADLPKKFVLKTNNGSHTNILCEDKSLMNIENTRIILNKWLNNRSVKLGREWPYYNIKPKIIAEKFLETNINEELIDYKFFCFNGEPLYIHIVNNGTLKSDKTRLSIVDMNFKEMKFHREDLGKLDITEIKKPKNYDEMIKIAKKLSKDFPHVRVDMYNIKGKIYFGELTFFPGSGYEEYTPNEYDDIIGEKFKLPQQNISIP